MAKLFEILAVENALQKKAKDILKDVLERFGHAGLFLGQERTYQPFDDAGQKLPDENKVLAARVPELVDEVKAKWGNWVDVSVQKEITNQSTGADVIVGERVILENMPTTALLNLEDKLQLLRRVVEAIPTLPLEKEWTYDENRQAYVSAPEKTYRTAKIIRTHVAYEATKEHPAQVQTYNVDENVGTWTTKHQSGMIPLVQKREALERIDKLAMAVKKARQRANNVDIKQIKVSDPIFDYIWE